MRSWKDNCVDLIVTSPPFNVGKHYGKASSDQMSTADYEKWLFDFCSECERVAAVAVYIFIAQKHMDSVKKNLAGFAQWVFWHRSNTCGSKPAWPWLPTVTPIAMSWTNGRKKMVNAMAQARTLDLIVAAAPQSNFSGDLKRYHVTQDPVAAYIPMIARTPGEIVLDPCMGSGTTALAAERVGKNWVGIEINPDYIKIAERRLAPVRAQMRML